jgi:hypothetical protein
MMPVTRTVLALVVMASAGCGPHAFVLPSTPGVPEPRAADIWTAASSTCRDTHNLHASVSVRGRLAGRRIPGMAGATLLVVVSDAGEIGIEARVSGQLAFKLGGRAEDATLFLPNDRRVVRGRAADIVNALVGVPIDPQALLAVLAGCVSQAAAVEHGDRFGPVVAVKTANATVYLEPRGAGAWRVRAGVRQGLAVSYDFGPDDSIRDISWQSTVADASVAFAVRVDALDRNVPLDPAMFSVTVPDDATPATIEELGRSGLTGEKR